MNDKARQHILSVLMIVLLLLCVFSSFYGSPEKYAKADSPLDPDDEPYYYWFAPPDSFGIQEMKTVNWTYFKQLFLDHTDWMLEYKRYSYSEWTDGLDYLTIERTWNDTGFWKFNLILDVPVDVYSARFTFGIDIPCLQYVEQSGYEVWINYTANTTETYSCMFNWSDIASIPNLVITKGRTDDMFWFRFRRDDIPSGHYEFDPTFGSVDVRTGTANIEDFIAGGNYTMNTTGGTGDNIYVYIKTYTASSKVKCALYDSDRNLINVTEERTNCAANNWNVFNFSEPKPRLIANTKYILVTWSDDNVDIAAQAGAAANSHWVIGDSYDGIFPDPIGSPTSSSYRSIYCSYTEGAINTTVDTISPYNQTATPLTITATSHNATPDNVTLYYRYSSDNVTWDNESAVGGIYTFGETNEGVMDANHGGFNDVQWGRYDAPANSGTVDNISIYIQDGAETVDVQGALYTYEDYTSDYAGTPLTNGITDIVECTFDGSDWLTLPFSGTKPTVVGGTTYYICVWGNFTNANFYVGRTDDYFKTWYKEDAGQWGWDSPITGETPSGVGTIIAYANYTAYSTDERNWTNFGTDTASPWSWSFDFPNGTGYYEFYSMANKSGVANESIPTNNDTLCQKLVNTAPTQSGESPIDTSTSVELIPRLYVVCTDSNSDTMTATWRSDSSGSWVDFATNSSISTGTNITQQNSNFSSASTTYYWSINLTDGMSWSNETYSFTTLGPWSNTAPSFSGESPANESIGQFRQPIVNVTITDVDGNSTDCNFYTSTNGVDWTWRQKNATVTANTSIAYDYTQASSFSTPYYWKVTAEDESINSSVIYHFTTKAPPDAGTDYYVKNGGSDGDNGLTDGTAWETMTKVNSELNGGVINTGDNIYFNRGDTWTGTTLVVRVGGTAANKMVIGAYGNGTNPVITGTAANGISFESAYANYVHIQNFTIHDVATEGGITAWGNYHNNLSISNCEIYDIDAGNGIAFRRIVNFTIDNCSVHDVNVGGYTIYGSSDLPRTANGTITDCVGYNCGTDTYTLHFQGGYGAPLGSNFILTNCTGYGTVGEEHFDLTSGTNIMLRRCNLTGTRPTIINHGPDNIIFDDCWVYSPSGADKKGISVDWMTNLVVRFTKFNFGVDGGSNREYSISLEQDSTPTSGNSGSGAFIAHNTFVTNTDATYHDDSIVVGSIWDDVTIKNNIFTTDTTSAPGEHIDNRVDLTSTNTIADTNMYHKLSSSNTYWEVNGIDLTEAQWNALSGVTNDVVDDPELTDPSNRDYTLRSTSPAIDAGTYLTQTNGGDVGNVVTVDEARWFFDGWGLIDGDDIVVGTDEVTITSVDYDTNQITVDSSITWSDGEGVYYAFNGAAPDLGAEESTGIVPDVPGSFTATTYDTTQINLTWSKGTGADYTYIEWYTSASWSIGTGTEIYNNTGTNYEHTSINPHTQYFYQGWSFNTTNITWSASYSSSDATTDNTAPVQSGEAPINSSTGKGLIPSLYVICTDSDAGDSMNATWRSNSSGSWVTFDTNSSIANNTNITQSNYNFTDASTTYWWSVNLTDGYDWDNETYHFSTTNGCSGVLPSIQIDSPLETYTVDASICLHTLIIEDTYVVFNYTGFNVTPASAINIRIDHIDEDIANPADGNDTLLVFTVLNTPGSSDFSISGFEPTVSYTVRVNDIYFDTVIADGSGNIDFSDSPSTNDEYSIFWTTGSNNAPTVTNPVPADLATGISTSPTLQATINDVDTNPMTYYIRTNESGLDWYTLKTDTEEPNGVISTTTSGNFTSDYTKYWWCVNLSDGTLWDNETYSFTTSGSGAPVIQTNEATNIQELNATLSGTLLNDGGETNTVWFEWDDTTALTAETANQTANSEETFTVSLFGNLTEWYNPNWVRRRQITIDDAYVDSDLDHYPIYLNISGDFSLAQTSGDDILFTVENGLGKLNHEIIRFTSKIYLECWVNITKLYAANNTVIWMYWGNDEAGNQENVGETWTDKYVGVYHLDEESNPTVYDSSGNGFDGTYYGDLPNRNVTRNGYGQYLDGTGDYISFPSSVYGLVHGNSAGYMAQVRQADSKRMPLWSTKSNDAPALDKQKTNVYYDPVGGTGYGLMIPRGSANSSAYSSWSGEYAVAFNPFTNWFMAMHEWTPSTASLYAEADGTIMTSTGIGEGIPDVGTYREFNFGYDSDTTYPVSQRYYKGYVDEIRIYQEIINSSWIKTDNYNFNEQAGFITVGDTETQYYDTGIISPGTNYFYRAIANNSDYRVYGSVVRFLTRPTEPQLFTALTENKSGIQLTWINGTGNNKTYIERSVSSTPWVRGTEYNIYNGSLLIYNDTGLVLDTMYFYQAWSYTNWTDNSTTLNQFSRNYDYAHNKTNSPPEFSNIFPVNVTTTDVPTNLSLTIIDPDGHTFNWTIETDPPIGSSNHNDGTNGTVTCRINGSHTTNYTWYVNCTDSYDWTNETYTFRYIVDHVDVPTDGNSIYDTVNNKLNLTWVGNTRANSYVVIQRNDTYSTSATQAGNWIRQNSSAVYVNLSWTATSGGFFTIYSYNTTVNIYSYNNATPLGLEIPWGALALSCFSENNATIALTFDILITNSTATESYSATGATNIHYIDMEDIPYGTDTIFQVSNSSYETRSYTYNIYQNNFYNLIFYLPLSLPGGGTSDPTYDENETYSENYIIHVIGPQSEYGVDPPIEGAEVIIRKYINTTDQYENVGSYETSADGTFTVPLLPNNLYYFNISADGYYDAVESWKTIELVFEGDRHQSFRLTPLAGEDIYDPDYDTFWAIIRFNATLHTNGSLFVNYVDSDTNTTDAQFYIYEIYNFSTTYITTNSTTNNTFSFWVTGLNNSRMHEIRIYLNHTTLGFITTSVFVGPSDDAKYTEDEIESKIENVFGPFRLGYVMVFLVYLPIVVLLVLPGPSHPGFAIIMASLYAGFASTFIVVGSILVIVPFAIVLGVILMAVKGGMLKL